MNFNLYPALPPPNTMMDFPFYDGRVQKDIPNSNEYEKRSLSCKCAVSADLRRYSGDKMSKKYQGKQIKINAIYTEIMIN